MKETPQQQPRQPGARSIADILHRNQNSYFIGRSKELIAITTFLCAETDRSPIAAHLTAASGCGKTTLLKVCVNQKAINRPVLWLDAADCRPDPKHFSAMVDALRVAHGVDEHTPHALIVDTFEAIDALQYWLMNEFIPAQSEGFRILLSGRSAPGLEWDVDSAWYDLHQHWTLAPFSLDEVAQYLERRGVPVENREEAYRFSLGNPLALALYTDSVKRQSSLDTQQLSAWRDRVLGGLNDPDKIAALEACCVVRALDKPLLARLLQRQDVTGVYAWLQAQSYIDNRDRGLIAHDIVRQSMVNDLKQRDPQRLLELGDLAFTEIHHRLDQGSADRLTLIQDAFFLLRDVDVQMTSDTEDSTAVYTDSVRAADWASIDRALRQFEGEASVEQVRRVHDHQPDALTVVRDKKGRALGFFQIVRVDRLPTETLNADPVCDEFLQWARHSLGCNGGVLLNRLWMGFDQDMASPVIYRQAFAELAGRMLTEVPGVCGAIQGDTPAWREAADRFGHLQLEMKGLQRRGIPAMLIYQDLSQDDQAGFRWMAQAYRKAFGLKNPSPSPARTPPAYSEISEFQSALRRALKQLNRPDKLKTHSVIHSLLFEPQHSAESDLSRMDTFKARFKDYCDTLAAHESTRPLARVLNVTYLNPAATQALAADRLGLSYATYRRRLQDALTLLCTHWWEEEQMLRKKGTEKEQ